MAANQQTYINGNRYSFVNISMQFNLASGTQNEPLKGVFKSINYDCVQEPGLVQGNQITIVGRTAGYGTATGAFELLVYDFDLLAAALATNGLYGQNNGQYPIMTVDFDITVAYSNNDIDTRVDTLEGCRITKIGSSNTQGSDATMKTCDLSIARVYLNGYAAFGDPSDQVNSGQ